jgi:hypothetical protein
LYVIFNIYDNIISPFNFSLYATIRVYGCFGPGLSQFLGPPLRGRNVAMRSEEAHEEGTRAHIGGRGVAGCGKAPAVSCWVCASCHVESCRPHALSSLRSCPLAAAASSVRQFAPRLARAERRALEEEDDLFSF